MKTIIKPRRRSILKQELFDALGCSNVAEIAEELGFRRTTIYGMLSGWRFPGADLQKTLTDKLGISKERLERLL